MPGNNDRIGMLEQKLNEVIKQLDEAYRLLHMDGRARDYRELPPHASIDHASWKFYINPENGDLELWHRSGKTWAKTYWVVTGDLTRQPSAG